MKFNKGDKVSFINEKQDGTVVRHINEQIVLVAIEDGFEIEVSARELVLVKPISSTPIQEQVEEVTKTDPLPGELLSLCPESILAIAAVPEQAVLTGSVAYYLLNNLNFPVVYTFYKTESNNKKGIATGIVLPRSMVSLFNSTREGLMDISSFIFRGIIFNEK